MANNPTPPAEAMANQQAPAEILAAPVEDPVAREAWSPVVKVANLAARVEANLVGPVARAEWVDPAAQAVQVEWEHNKPSP